MLKAIFFDLDGTLLDTAADLTHACNAVLKKYDLPLTSISTVRQSISAGTSAILCDNFKMSIDDPRFKEIRTSFLNYYEQNLAVETVLFPGMDVLLDQLEAEGRRWGVVTGKVGHLAAKLLTHFGLNTRSCCLVAGDTVPQAKPHPAPLLHACGLIDHDPRDCIYIGDADTDIKAAQAAKMHSIAVTYGYFKEDQNPYHWDADYVVSDVSELLDSIRQLENK